MAPTPPLPPKRLTARQKVRSRLAASAGPALPKTFRPSAVIADTGFLNTKRDKRLIKSSSFASRIAKTSSTTKKKRSRPSKSLVASLDSLGDALDSITADLAASGHAPMDREQAAQGRVRHRSLRSRPGALKRKERVVKAEMERFGRSLANMSAAGEQQQQSTAQGEQGETQTQGAPAAPSSTSSRWAALRGQISQTMEQNPAFLDKA
ncbi:ribosome biogenesis protein SLX9-domain-containing protein [Schizothecium vesticola]|uniref:Ribosome biogenesis protein SLX9 n=1 Tax=Schizothecium vesticola TaxID=314040 RepID=A0AA40F5V4_9PEZI|nr:ribosome biogenesis protein SLX9-domain-containing protein [Schizothecium vesticola]